jgi:hypothetical protein
LGQGFEFAKILSKTEGQYEFDTANNFTCLWNLHRHKPNLTVMKIVVDKSELQHDQK